MRDCRPTRASRLPRQAVAFCAFNLGKAHGQFHIFRERHAGDQIERLKHHSNGVQAILRQSFAGQLREIFAVNDHAA